MREIITDNSVEKLEWVSWNSSRALVHTIKGATPDQYTRTVTILNPEEKECLRLLLNKEENDATY